MGTVYVVFRETSGGYLNMNFFYSKSVAEDFCTLQNKGFYKYVVREMKVN